MVLASVLVARRRTFGLWEPLLQRGPKRIASRKNESAKRRLLIRLLHPASPRPRHRTQGGFRCRVLTRGPA